MEKLKTHILGYPRIGKNRELKTAVESYWKREISGEALNEAGKQIRTSNRTVQTRAGLDHVPCNDFSFYDQMLDMSCLVGNIPERFGWNGGPVGPDLYFALARGNAAARACEMTKWFDTNYHYIVPEINAKTTFKLSSEKVFEEFEEARQAGALARPVLIGPITYLLLSKVTTGEAGVFDRWSLLDPLVEVYGQILNRLQISGAEWVQIDEPALCLDLSKDILALFDKTYRKFKVWTPKLYLLLAGYFGELRENFETVAKLPVDAIHLDAVRGAQEVERLIEKWPQDKILSLGIIDGRNIWKTDYSKALPLIRKTVNRLGSTDVWLAPSCSLLHAPLSLEREKDHGEIRLWLSFAEEKLQELQDLAQLALGRKGKKTLEENRAVLERRESYPAVTRPEVRQKTAQITDDLLRRNSSFLVRQNAQREKLRLPLFPTTTIGSFPQTKEVRAWRAQWKQGKLEQSVYEAKLRAETEVCIRKQEKIGLDVLVHGEFERNDMVEYFGEQLSGFIFTVNGWVQSYGTRCVKPPVIYGDISRPVPMTVEWYRYAQSLSAKPVKGMLTGPITILQWSFVRDDVERKEVAFQLGLAIRDEVQDLEEAGAAVIQIDEPALREGLPLRRNGWAKYLEWAVNAFKLCASGVKDDTQVHTHMCYSEFNDIIEAIARIDADVITIETSRSHMELLNAFESFDYPNEIGPGVYEIHSPRVPTAQEMANLLEKAATKIPIENLWVNPDCGLKTRDWPEVEAALTRMVEAAKALRKRRASSGHTMSFLGFNFVYPK